MDKRSDYCVIVAGEDWEGEPVARALRPGWSVCLRGQMGQGFDVRGPHATMCGECGEPLFVEGGHTTAAMQRHLWEAHSVSATMLYDTEMPELGAQGVVCRAHLMEV